MPERRATGRGESPTHPPVDAGEIGVGEGRQINPNGATAPALDVLHILWRGTGGGAERHVLDLAGESARRGVRTGVLYLSCDGGAGTDLDRLGVLHRSLSLRRGFDPAGPGRVAKSVSSLKPRLVHDHVSVPWLRALLPSVAGRPIVATEHGHLLRPEYTRERPRLWIERLGARRTDLYLAPSRAIAEAVERHYRYPAGRIRVIPHGIRPPAEGLAPSTRADVRRELGIGAEALILLFVGRLDEAKGILDLWEAFVRMTGDDRGAGGGDRAPSGSARPDRSVLVVAGTGVLEARLKRRLDESGLSDRARLLGFRTDIGRLFSASDIFILPARHEAFGIVLLEAMAAGVPVVATRTGGIPEIVVDGVTGLLVTPGDPEGLGRAVGELAEDAGKRQSLGRAGRRRWEEAFSLDRSVDATLEAYRWIRDRKA